MSTANPAAGVELGTTQLCHGGIPNYVSAPNHIDLEAVGREFRRTPIADRHPDIGCDVAIACVGVSRQASKRYVRTGAKRLGRRLTFVSNLLTLLAVSYVLALTGCAPHSAQRASNVNSAHASAPVHRYAEVCRSNRALLARQPAPKCEFGDPELETTDPDLWARVKLDYERQCYRNAETVVRNRLRLLQASVRRCEVERTQYSMAAGSRD
jgi:hypothetical protein